jgi:Lon-like ATP-dependent protease
MRKLKTEQLYRFTKIDSSDFLNKEADLRSFMKRFHPRAFQSLNFGLHLKRKQNHIFIMGENGVGRIGMSKTMLRQAAKRKSIPSDVVLVSDFSESNKTRYLYLPAGRGHVFKVAVETFINQLKAQLPVVFDSHAYQLKNQQLDKNLSDLQQAELDTAYDLAESLSVDIEQVESSFVLTAIVDGKCLKMQAIEQLEEPIQKKFIDAFDKVEEALNKGLTKFPFLQHEFLDAGRKLNTEVSNDYLNPLIADLKKEFAESKEIEGYLDALQDAIVARIQLFWNQSDEQVTTTKQGESEEALVEQQGFAIFEVNLLVDQQVINRELAHAPVIYEQNATMPKLFGYTINSASANATDTISLAMNHQAGLLQKASGGFLMINIESVLKDPEIWSNLKAALTSKKLSFEIPSTSNVVPYHLPDFPLDVTLVLLGRATHFHALQEIDNQFSRLFKVQVEFENELERTPEHELVLAQQLATETEDWEDLPVAISAYERLIECSSRMVESEARLYTNKAILRDVLAEAHAYARANDEKEVTRETIEATLLQREFHTGMMEDYFHQEISEEQVLISVTGKHVGQVNGLTVLTVGRQSFGQPVRITSQAAAGDEGVLDIETEVEMSGPIHSKGMLILSGYLRGRYMKDKALGFSASIVMEQTYDGIEGDSASSAELVALISSITGEPLRQDLAITGSINQFGKIQPIGGVNEKIEGFYKVCKARGITGTQGAVIPEANTKHLMLNEEVRQAVADGQFHIYAMSHIDDALELFTGIPVGEANAVGKYPEGSLNHKVVAVLEKMNEKVE